MQINSKVDRNSFTYIQMNPPFFNSFDYNNNLLGPLIYKICQESKNSYECVIVTLYNFNILYSPVTKEIKERNHFINYLRD